MLTHAATGREHIEEAPSSLDLAAKLEKLEIEA